MIEIDNFDTYLRYLAGIAPHEPPQGDAACARIQPEFATIEQQRAAFDDDPDAPIETEDVLAARQICARCPLLDQCRDYARRSCVDDGILAGMTAGERRTRRRKSDLVALRDRRVQELADRGVPTPAIAALLEVDVTAIRRHLRGWTLLVG